MKTRLSNSAVDLYNQCSLCYKLKYLEGIRPIQTGSPLVFGSAIDKALNHLLLNKSLTQSRAQFIEDWEKVKTQNIKYSKSDIDWDLIKPDSKNPPWDTLLEKGLLFINAYYNEVLPKINLVIAVQDPITILNSDGDEITGFLDLIVEWEDGKTYLMDNKTSSVKYESNAAKEGQQLPLYYYPTKDKYKLNGVGYIVLSKKINKNKVKKCLNCCSINNSSHIKCNEQINTSHQNITDIFKRCNGKFETTINPTVDIQYIFNQVKESDIDRVIETFDHVNYCVSNNLYNDFHNPERGKFGWCPFKEYHEGSPEFYKK